MTKYDRILQLSKVITEVQLDSLCKRGVMPTSTDYAEALYDAGYRMIDGEENEVLTAAVDATFRGAVLRLAEKLKERIRDVVFISKDEIINWDILIDETAQKFLKCET